MGDPPPGDGRLDPIRLSGGPCAGRHAAAAGKKVSAQPERVCAGLHPDSKRVGTML